jgi:hypothetical protein
VQGGEADPHLHRWKKFGVPPSSGLQPGQGPPKGGTPNLFSREGSLHGLAFLFSILYPLPSLFEPFLQEQQGGIRMPIFFHKGLNRIWHIVGFLIGFWLYVFGLYLERPVLRILGAVIVVAIGIRIYLESRDE